MSMLAGLRVVEIADGFTDLGGRMLAEMGAEVICILPEGLDVSDGNEIAWHHGKRLVAGNLDDTDALRGLIAGSDILLDGQRNGSRKAVAEAAQTFPDLIHVAVRPFSEKGPYAGRPATDLTLMALSGLMTMIGEPEKPPLKLPGQQAYALTGIQAATAALMALHARRRTGHGQRVDLSAFQSAALANYRSAVMYEWTGKIGKRTGNRLVRGKSGVRQVWPCADGYVTWSMIDNPAMMKAVVRIMAEHNAAGELADIDWENILVADTEQATIERWQDQFGAFFAAHTKTELGAWSLENGWGLSVIAELDEVRSSDHLAARGLFVEVTDKSTGQSAMLPGPLFRHGAGADTPDRELASPLKLSDVSWGMQK